MQLPMLMACNPYRQIRRRLARSNGEVQPFHNESMQSWMVHTHQLKVIAVRMHRVRVMNRNDHQQVPSCHRQRVEILEGQALAPVE